MGKSRMRSRSERVPRGLPIRFDCSGSCVGDASQHWVGANLMRRFCAQLHFIFYVGLTCYVGERGLIHVMLWAICCAALLSCCS